MTHAPTTGDTTIQVEHSNPESAAAQRLKKVRREHGLGLIIVVLAAGLAVLAPRPPSFVDVIFYSVLAALTAYVGVTWAIEEFRVAFPREGSASSKSGKSAVQS